VTIHPRFPSQDSPDFQQQVPEKNHCSPWTPICPIFGLVSRICPDIDKLRCSTVQILIVACWSVYTKELLVAGTLPRTLLGELTMLPQTPKSDPQWIVPAALAPYNSCLRCFSQIAVPKLWSLYIKWPVPLPLRI